jgi:hypothetical protein
MRVPQLLRLPRTLPRRPSLWDAFCARSFCGALGGFPELFFETIPSYFSDIFPRWLNPSANQMSQKPPRIPFFIRVISRVISELCPSHQLH